MQTQTILTNKPKLDISSYLVIGPENTLGRPVSSIIKAVLEAGFTCIQIRAKHSSAKDILALAKEAADLIAQNGMSQTTTLLLDDRLDIVLAARKQGIKVDGIHIGQSDIPVDVCRHYLGENSIIGLSACADNLFEYIKTADIRLVDYFGSGPLRETQTKPDCGLCANGTIKTRSLEDIKRLAQESPIPVVIGGGVKIDDIPLIAQTGIGGFFVVSAITEAQDPKKAACEFVRSWEKHSIKN